MIGSKGSTPAIQVKLPRSMARSILSGLIAAGSALSICALVATSGARAEEGSSAPGATAAPATGTAAAPAAAAAPATATTLSTAPDFIAESVDGPKIQLRELLAKGPVLLDFWATWCKPCMQELPELQKLHEKYRDRGFTLLGVPSDDSRTVGKVKPLVRSRGFKFPNVYDANRAINNQYSVRNYPTAFLIASDGKIVSVSQGYRPGDEKAIEEKLLKLLAASPESSGTPPAQGGSEGKETGAPR